MKAVARFEIDDPRRILARRNLETGGAVQKYIDAEVIRQCEPYVPFDEGVLTASASTATDIGSGEVIYNTPYAHYQYYGVVYGPNIPMTIGGELTFRSPSGATKVPTGQKLTYNKEVHPQAGSFWFERMKADHKKDILDGAKKIAGVK
jgi:hypothetical protein